MPKAFPNVEIEIGFMGPFRRLPAWLKLLAMVVSLATMLPVIGGLRAVNVYKGPDEWPEYWDNETHFEQWLVERRLEEKNVGNTKRGCVRVIKQMQEGLFKMRIPESQIDVYVPCLACHPTR